MSVPEGGGGGGEAPRLSARDPAGHKGTFGTVVVIGGTCAGSARMIGAPALAARAALRAGAGLVRIAAPAPIVEAAVALCPSATGVALPVDEEDGSLEAGFATLEADRALEGAGAVVIGPGLGTGAVEQGLVMRVVANAEAPVVADADAINALADHREFWRDLRAPLVLTPHPGEFRRLAAALSIAQDPARAASRPAAAEAMARRLGCVVALKGAGTVVSDGQRTWVCERGTHALATGGTGDVLAGLVGGLIASNSVSGGVAGGVLGARAELWALTRIAVEAHALAGELWCRRRGASAGLLAQELADLLPEALEPFRG